MPAVVAPVSAFLSSWSPSCWDGRLCIQKSTSRALSHQASRSNPYIPTPFPACSFVGVGVLVQLVSFKLGWTPWRAPQDIDQQALFLLLNQSARTASGLLVIWAVVRPYRPLPEDLFHISEWARRLISFHVMSFWSHSEAPYLACYSHTALFSPGR